MAANSPMPNPVTVTHGVLLPAPSLASAGPPLIMQHGQQGIIRAAHVDA